MNNVGEKLVARRRDRPAAGLSLVEVMTVAALSSLIMATLLSFAINLKQADRRMRLANVESARLIALAEKLRTDIRRGTGVSLPESNLLVVTLAGGEESRYELGPQGCGRSLVSADNAKPPSDLFVIGQAESWTIEEGPPGRHPLYMVTLKRTRSQDDTKPRRMPLMVYAALGADLPVEPAASSAE